LFRFKKIQIENRSKFDFFKNKKEEKQKTKIEKKKNRKICSNSKNKNNK
jgi:hypothetical protein